jgi:hypothetical protein
MIGRKCSTVALATCLCISSTLTYAQSATEVFGSVTALTSWFSKLNEQFDAAVKTESRAQLGRAVDRLRKDLYALEVDTRILMERVPDMAPTPNEREGLDALAAELQSTVQRLAASARSLGADLRLNDAENVEFALTSGLHKRGYIVTEVRRALLPSANTQWNGAALRGRLAEGIEAVKSAQLGVTEFSRRLAASR